MSSAAEEKVRFILLEEVQVRETIAAQAGGIRLWKSLAQV